VFQKSQQEDLADKSVAQLWSFCRLMKC